MKSTLFQVWKFQQFNKITTKRPLYAPDIPPLVVVGESVYPAELSLYKTSNFETVHMGLPVYNAFDATGDVTRVNAEVRLLNGTQTENIAIQLNNCWATPTAG